MLVPYCGGDAHRCGVWCISYSCSQREYECTEESACWCHNVGVMHTGAVCGKVEGWHVVCVLLRQSVCTSVCVCVCVLVPYCEGDAHRCGVWKGGRLACGVCNSEAVCVYRLGQQCACVFVCVCVYMAVAFAYTKE